MQSADGRFRFSVDGDPVPAGAKPTTFDFWCPRGRRWCAGLLIRSPTQPGEAARRPPSWIWDGNVDAPTFAPSINHEGCWHGYIEKGVFLTCNKTPEPDQQGDLPTGQV